MKLSHLLAMVGLLLLSASWSPVIAQTTPVSEDPVIDELDKKVVGFFNNLANSEVPAEAAFADLLAGGRLADKENEPAVLRLAEQTKDFPRKYGQFVGSELVSARRVGQDVVLMTCLYKSRDFPVVWYFAFYRTLDKWSVISVRFDTRLEALGLLGDESKGAVAGE